MARKNTTQVEFKGYVQIALTADEIPLVTQAAEDMVAMYAEMENMLRDAYRITIVPDLDAKTVKVTAQDIRSDRTSCGWMLSGEAPSFPLALAVLLYKHIQKMGKKWVPFLTEKDEVQRIR